MGTLLLFGAGVFVGWLLFRPKRDKREAAPQKALPSQVSVSQSTTREREQCGHNHTLRDVAGGVAAGVVLGHVLSDSKKTEAHETINNYNVYDEVYDHEDFADHELEDEDAYIATYDDDDDDYVSYDDVDNNDYDSVGDWDGDSYDGGEW